MVISTLRDCGSASQINKLKCVTKKIVFIVIVPIVIVIVFGFECDKTVGQTDTMMISTLSDCGSASQINKLKCVQQNICTSIINTKHILIIVEVIWCNGTDHGHGHALLHHLLLKALDLIFVFL